MASSWRRSARVSAPAFQACSTWPERLGGAQARALGRTSAPRRARAPACRSAGWRRSGQRDRLLRGVDVRRAVAHPVHAVARRERVVAGRDVGQRACAAQHQVGDGAGDEAALAARPAPRRSGGPTAAARNAPRWRRRNRPPITTTLALDGTACGNAQAPSPTRLPPSTSERRFIIVAGPRSRWPAGRSARACSPWRSAASRWPAGCRRERPAAARRVRCGRAPATP